MKIDTTKLPPGYTMIEDGGGRRFLNELGESVVWIEFDSPSIRVHVWADYYFRHPEEKESDANG